MTALANLVRVVSTTTGTGTLTLGAAVQGFLTPTQAGAIDNQIVTYAIEADYVSNIPTSREIGYGTLGGTQTTLTRNVVNSTNTNALLNLAGDEQVFITLKKDDIREVLNANRTYFVRTDGNDSNSGLANTAGGAFLTLQHAWNVIVTLDLSGFTATISIGAGTYTSSPALGIGAGYSTSPQFGGPVIISGAGSTTILNPAAPAFCISTETETPYPITLQNMKLITNVASFGSLLNTSNLGHLVVGSGMEFGATDQFALLSSSGGVMEVTAGYTISGNGAGGHMRAWRGGTILNAGFTHTLTGTPAFGTYALAQTGSLIIAESTTFSGSGTGTRYSATENGVIFTAGAGATYFPGNVAGSTASGGQYT